MPITKINSLGITNPVSFSAGTAALPSITFSGDTNTGVFAPAADTIGFTEGGAEAMRINSSGNLSIGTNYLYARIATKPISGEYGFVIFDTNDAIRSANLTAETYGYQWVVVIKYNGDAAFRFENSSNTNVGNIIINASSTAYNTTSDFRLKENIIYNLNGIKRVKLLKPARFNFITEPDKTVDGFLAHEVSEIVPEAITGTKNQVEAIGNITDVEGNIIKENVAEPNELPENQTWTETGTRPVYQGIDQSKLVPLLTGALQEAIARIESLEARLTALESK